LIEEIVPSTFRFKLQLFSRGRGRSRAAAAVALHCNHQKKITTAGAGAGWLGVYHDRRCDSSIVGASMSSSAWVALAEAELS